MDFQKKFQSFVKGISREDHIAILHDTDADGICSAVITAKALQKLGFGVERFIPCSHANFNQVRLQSLKEEGINKIILLDFAGDQYPDFKKEVGIFDAVLLIDHHKIYADLNSRKIVFIKAQYIRKDLDGSDYCTSKLVFDLFSKLADISELDWLAAIGMLTDMTYDKGQSFLGKIYRKYKTSKDELIKVGNVIDAGKQIEPPQTERALEVVLKAGRYGDILASDFSRITKALQNEIEFWVNKFEETAEHRGSIWFYEIDPSGRVGSTISTLLALKYPNDTILVARHQNGWVSVNARNHNSKRAVNDLLEKAAKGFKGSNAGGHTPAAGATVREKDFEEFRKRIWKLA